jgi:hypothetical protein
VTPTSFSSNPGTVSPTNEDLIGLLFLSYFLPMHLKALPVLRLEFGPAPRRGKLWFQTLHVVLVNDSGFLWRIRKKVLKFTAHRYLRSRYLPVGTGV